MVSLLTETGIKKIKINNLIGVISVRFNYIITCEFANRQKKKGLLSFLTTNTMHVKVWSSLDTVTQKKILSVFSSAL